MLELPLHHEESNDYSYTILLYTYSYCAVGDSRRAM